ncbi:DUF1572 domain-containing protein [Aureispira sp. CCB-E]|uniref:DUF1572 domain-containing protein n=1 Tax=Aureispira sp. CCB-E TaxID=3051121 RepID=UPI00286873DB|nr:DUF1572 domain-containing protein [Aureispira sp. CCB-E]WMX17253.1 DUF1572 domain-containing protein [Aureispira sp. CCB-E]
MKQSKQIANRFREVLLSGQWIANTNCKEMLSGISWQEAIRKIGSLNTIHGLTYHIDYYVAGVLNVLEGGTLDIRDKYSFDCPEITCESDWDNLLNSMWSNAEQFANCVEKMSDEQLEKSFVDEKYGNYRRNIEAIIEHSYYHLGQISLIKKMLREGI